MNKQLTQQILHVCHITCPTQW